jgi:hypothetical protein
MSQLDTSHEEVKPLRSRRGRLWSPGEEATLRRLYQEGVDHLAMAQELRRSVHGIIAKLGNMGLSTGASRKPPAVRPVERSIRMVSHHYGISIEELCSGEGQALWIVCPRSVVAWLANQLGASSPLTGRRLKRDHTTILMSCRRVNRWRAADHEFRALTDRMLADLQEGAR